MKPLEQAARDGILGLELLSALAKRGRTASQLRLLLDSEEALDALAAEVERLSQSTVSVEGLQALGLIDPNTPAVRLRNFLRCASWPAQYREGEPLAVGLLLCGTVEFVDRAINALTSGSNAAWRRAALCLYFGLSGQDPIEDHGRIASMVGQESVSSWLSTDGRGYSFSKLLSNLLTEWGVPSGPTSLLELPIEALSLTVRTRNLLRGVDVELVSDLSGHTVDSLCQAWSGKGRVDKCVDEVASTLRRRGVWS